MAIHRLNHAVLYVRNVATSVAFYRDVLGFEVITDLGGQAAFLRAEASSNDHDLGLFEIGAQAAASPAGRSAVGLYHLAWEVDTLRDLEAIARPAGRGRGTRRRVRPQHHQSRSTGTTPTAWSSRSPGSCRPIGSTTRHCRAARASGRSTSAARSPGTGPTPLAESASVARLPSELNTGSSRRPRLGASPDYPITCDTHS